MPARRPPAPGAIGSLFVIAAYFLWGVLPLYFAVLAPAGAFEVVGWRIVLSLVFCVILIALTRAWGTFWAIVCDPRLLGFTALAGALIYANWQVFVLAAQSGRVIETSLGYFITPIVTVLLAVVVLREHLRVMQWIAIGVAALAVAVIVIGYGSFPWVSIALAFSFGIYGLVKKKIGPRVDAVSGLTLESAWLTPVAIVQLWIVGATSGLTIGSAGLAHSLLLGAAGVITAVPLLLFAAGTRRTSLIAVGLLQFIAPVLQFLIGWLLLGERMTDGRWLGFALVWLAVLVLSADSVLASSRASRRLSAPASGFPVVTALDAEKRFS